MIRRPGRVERFRLSSGFAIGLIVSLLVLAITGAPAAHATTPILLGKCNGSAIATSQACAISAHVASGSALVVIQIDATHAASSVPTDNASNTYVNQIIASCLVACGGSYWVGIYSATAGTTGGLSITVHATGETNTIAIFAFAVSGVSATAVTAINVCSSGAGCGSTPTASPAVPAGSSFCASGIRDNMNGGGMSVAGSGYTLYTIGGTAAGGTEYATALSGTTNFPVTLSGAPSVGWAYAGACFGGATTTTPYGGNCASVSVCTSVSGFNVTANSAIVVVVEWSNSFITFPTVTDSLGNTYGLPWSYYKSCTDFPTCAAGNVVSAAIYVAASNVLGTGNKITLTFGATITSIGYEIYDLANTSPSPSCTTFGASSSSVNLAASGPCAVPAGFTAIGGLAGLASNTLTAGASFTLQASGLANMQAESLTAGILATSTVFPATISAATAVVDVGIVLGPATSSTGTSIIGSCPTKNTATTTLANNTEYFYTGIAFTSETVGTVSTFVAQVTSAATPQTLSLGIYATQNPGAISASNTLFLVAAFSKSLTAGTTNNAISWSSALSLSNTIIGVIPSGATVGIAILGTDKIKINQSSLSGIVTGATSGNVLASTYTSLSANAAKLYLCASANYQVVVTTTTTSTTTVSTTTTSTTTINGTGPVPGASVNPNLYMALAIIATLFLVPLKFAGFAGAILGAVVGFGISIAAGLLPTVYIIVLVVGLVAAFFFLRTMNAPGGGGV